MTPRGQEPNESTDDAVWLDIVARLEQTPAGTAPEPERDAPRTNTPTDTPLTEASLTDRQRADAVFENQPLRRLGPRDHEAAETGHGDDDTRYVPPEPPPLGAGDPLLVISWLAAAGGPVMLLAIAMFWRSAPLSVWLGVLAVFVAGAGYLLTRLPGSRDDYDDGAEV